MKVLMFGWEFPPHHSGGLGIACYGLTKGLSNQGVKTLFVMPKFPFNTKYDHIKLISANVKFKKINSLLLPYINSSTYSSIRSKSSGDMYGQDLYQEVYRFAEKAKIIAKRAKFDVIHAHDWMTYPAAVNAKMVSGKPLVVHMHNTAFDRTGGNPSKYEYDIEKYGFEQADKVIAISHYVKNTIVTKYGISPDKVAVVHNGIAHDCKFNLESFGIKKQDKIVLFLGRVTLQKGPDYFLYAAKKVLDKDSNVKFVVAGTGDMLHFMIEKASELGIAKNFIYTGFVSREDGNRLYKMADVFVMPSVSEPFGLTPLEAMQNQTPVIISKQSGVSEVINHCLKVDFWDIDDMSNKILAVLKYKALSETLKDNGSCEVDKINWDEPAKKCIDVYKSLINQGVKAW